MCVGKIFIFWFCEGSACVSPSWSAGRCRNTAKLSAEFWSVFGGRVGFLCLLVTFRKQV